MGGSDQTPLEALPCQDPHPLFTFTMPVLISLDLGTSKICGIAFDVDSEHILAVSTHTNTGTVEEKLPLFCHEQDVLVIASLCEKVVMELLDALDALGALEECSNVIGFSFSGQMHGVVLADQKTLHPLSPLITWRDQRISEAEDVPGYLLEAIETGGRTPHCRTGSHLSPGYGGPTLSYLRSTQPHLFKDGVVALSIASYIAACWTSMFAPYHTPTTTPTHVCLT
jgi:sugar (pentulose or hexulose) kinase